MKLLIRVLLCLSLLLLAGVSYAQDKTPEATAEATLEATAEATPDVTPEATPESTSEPVVIPGPGGYTISGTIGGFERSYHIYVPKSYTAEKPMPLLFVFHGAGSTGVNMAGISDFNTMAETEGFIAVYPDGINRIWNDGRPPDPAIGPVDDVGFVTVMLQTIEAALSIDVKRIYATGYSAGGMFSYRLGCDLPDQFAAVASVASTFPEYLSNNCKGTPPIPLLVFQGTDDPIIPWIGYQGGYLSASKTLDYWGDHNACLSTNPFAMQDDTHPDDGTRILLASRGDCALHADVRLYGVFLGGHTWPGHPVEAPFDLGLTSTDIDASQVIWDFFATHPKP
ncbi:MAG: PHB depolymerase family esterase [Chloroflexota bacterium]